MTLIWGVRAFYIDKYEDLEEAIAESVKILKDKKLLASGDCVVFIGSIPMNEHGKTNILKVSYI